MLTPNAITKIRKEKLSNGLTILADPDERFTSAALTIYFLGGLRDETPEDVGVTHLLEHLLLKRTQKQSTKEIAAMIDELGGDVNAYTDSESMYICGTVPGTRAISLFRFLAELALEPKFIEEDLELEKEVVRQEILESEDDPGDVVYHKFSELYWYDSMLRYPIFGTLDSVSRLQREHLEKRHRELLVGQRIIVAASGNVNFEELVAETEKLFGHLEEGERAEVSEPGAGSGFAAVVRPVQQAHVVLGWPWPAPNKDDYYAGVVCSTVLGEGMSSRLFQSVREEKGLAYDISSDVDSLLDTAALSISAALERKNLQLAIEVISEEVERLLLGGISSEELERAKKLITAHFEMESDFISARLWRAVETEVHYGRYLSAQEVVNSYRAVEARDIENVITKWLKDRQELLVVGGDVEGFSPKKLMH